MTKADPRAPTPAALVSWGEVVAKRLPSAPGGAICYNRISGTTDPARHAAVIRV